MQNYSLLFFLALSLYMSILHGQQEESIYNSKIIRLVSLWNRVADKSFKLRSVEAAEISPNEKYSASASKFGYKVVLWNTLDGSLIWENEHESEVECITFSPDSKKVASGGEDNMLNIWAVDSGKLIKGLEHHSALDGLTWSHDGKTIATGTEKGLVHFWSVDTFDLMYSLKVGSTVNSLQFTKDDSKLIVGGNNQNPDPITGEIVYTGFALLIDMESKEVIQEYHGNRASVKSVRISNNEKWVATGSFDKSACLFELETGTLLHRFKEPHRIEAVEFSPDNQFLLTGGHGDSVKFYGLSDYALVKELALPRTEYIHFSEDGRLLLTSHEDSGLLALHLMVSDTQAKQGFYQKLADKQLNNKDLKPNRE